MSICASWTLRKKKCLNNVWFAILYIYILLSRLLLTEADMTVLLFDKNLGEKSQL